MGNTMIQVGTRWVSACTVIAIIPMSGQVNVYLEGFEGFIAGASTDPHALAASLAASVSAAP